MVLQVEVNLHQEPMQIEVQSPTQVVGYVLVLMVLPAGKNWLFKVRKTSGIQCFKCGGRGHVIRECPNNRTIIVNDQGEYESASEEEQEAMDGG